MIDQVGAPSARHASSKAIMVSAVSMRVREKLRGGARVLRRPVELLFERNAGFGEHLGAGAAEAVDERPVAEIEGVRQLRHLRGRPVEIAVMEEQLQATEDLLR